MGFAKRSLAVLAIAFLAILGCTSDDPDSQSEQAAVTGSPTPTPVVTTANGVTRVVVHLSSLLSADGEGQVGFATLTSDGTTTTVEVDVSPPATEAQPIHVHTTVASCESLPGALPSR